jgi:raffinose/stachyose/melibiose transport system permease protein
VALTRRRRDERLDRLPGLGRGNTIAPSWLFLAPALLVYVVVVIYPFVDGAGAAFTDWNGLTQSRNFVGLNNFFTLVNDAVGRAALLHTIVIAVVVTIAQNAIGLALALILHRGLKSRFILRTVFFLPAVLAPLVMGYVWRYIYAPSGTLDQLLDLLHLGALKQDWLGDPNVALWSVLASMTWQYVGYSMIIFIAGLESVPKDLYEAASLDGAGAFARLTRVTMPLLAPALTINLMLTLIGGLKAFDVVIALTDGGPGYATETMSTLLYRNAFITGDYGYGASIALVLSVIVAAFGLAQLSILRRRELRMQ